MFSGACAEDSFLNRCLFLHPTRSASLGRHRMLVDGMVDLAEVDPLEADLGIQD